MGLRGDRLHLERRKRETALGLGAHHVIDSRDADALGELAGSLDFILATVNVDLDWSLYLRTLAPRGRLHVVGAAPSPLSVPAFSLIASQLSVSGSPVGSPATTASMLEFCTRHRIALVTERFPLSQVNEALAHLAAGKARYRIVLDNDLA